MKSRMKKVIALIVLALMLFMGLSALAEEPDPNTEVPSVLPGSFWYPLKVLGENVRTFFTFSSEAKLERHQLLSQRRLIELEAVIENAPEMIDRATENYRRQQQKIERVLNQVAQQGPDREELMNWLEESISWHIDAFDRLKEQVPDDARAALEQARTAAQEGRNRVIEVISNWNPEGAFNRYKGLMDDRLDQLEEIDPIDEEEVDALLNEWCLYNDALRRMSKSNGQINTQINSWQGESLERLDDLEDRFNQRETIQERVREARAEAVETQIEALRQIREENRWAEIEDDFNQTALQRVERLQERVAEMDQDCPESDRENCLLERQKMVEALSQEYQQYTSLGEEVIEQDWNALTTSGHNALGQAGQQAIQMLEQVYNTAPEEALEGLEQAIASAERLRHLNNEALGTLNQIQEGSTSDNPSIERVQERVRQELAPQLETIQNRFGQ